MLGLDTLTLAVLALKGPTPAGLVQPGPMGNGRAAESRPTRARSRQGGAREYTREGRALPNHHIMVT